MKKTYNIIIASLVTVLFMGIFTSCVKSRAGRTDFSGLAPIVEIPEGGFQNFGNTALNFPASDASDTNFFHVDYAAVDLAPKDITVTLSVDAAALAAYNANPANVFKYEAFPDSIYSIQKTVTIKAGQHYSDAIPLVVFPSKVDPSKNYMLPLSITDAQGNAISGNFGTIYFHFVGNPIAGSYKWDFTRHNSPDPNGPLSGLSFVGHNAVFSPDDPFTVEVATGYYTQPRYVIHFDNNNGVLSNFTVTFNQSDIAGVLAAGIVIAVQPHFTILDPVNKIFQIEYQTGSRYIVDKFYKQ